MKFVILLIVIFGLTFIVTYLFFTLPESLPISNKTGDRSYRTDFSEGICTTAINTCQWAGDGCGGGHGYCTSIPWSHQGDITTCDINSNFPANEGYKCTCLASFGPIGKCGWVK